MFFYRYTPAILALMLDLEFLILLILVTWVWWIVPRRRSVEADMREIFERLQTIERKLGLDYEAAEKLSKSIREDT
jgi:hypothetical protein